MEDIAVSNFKEYLRIKTVQPDPDYVTCNIRGQYLLLPVRKGSRYSDTTMMRRSGVGNNWCPTKHCVDPPIYGDSMLKKFKEPRRNDLRSEKIYNTPRSDRSNNEDEAEDPQRRECMSRSWRESIPRGTTVCCNPNSYRRDAAEPPRLPECRQNLENDKKRGKDLKNIGLNCLVSPSPSSVFLPTGFCSRSAQSRKGKQFYSVMWDPRVCRGQARVRLEDHQMEKCKKQLDLNRWMEFKVAKKNRLRKWKEKEGGYLDKRSNPEGLILYPSVHPEKEPITYNSFLPFLTDQTEKPECVNRKQGIDRYEDLNVNCGGLKGKGILTGEPKSCQTETAACKSQTEDYIVHTLLEKIPEQATLEVMEEAELETIRGERGRWELVFLYRKWQQMKEDQWNEWLYQWNEIRMNEIFEEMREMQEKEERLFIVAFSQSVMKSCMQQITEDFKRDGFVNKNGVPYEELNAMEKAFGFLRDVHRRLNMRNKMSRKLLDSVVTQSVVQRFAGHMNDEYGKPHGRWLKRKGQNSLVAYDKELQDYLEGRWIERKGAHLGSADLRQIKTDLGFKEIFKDLEDEELPQAQRTFTLFNISKLERLVAEAISDDGNAVPLPETPPPTPLDSVIQVLDKVLAAGKSKMSIKGSRAGASGEQDDGRAEADDDFSVLFKRLSTFERDVNEEEARRGSERKKKGTTSFSPSTTFHEGEAPAGTGQDLEALEEENA